MREIKFRAWDIERKIMFHQGDGHQDEQFLITSLNTNKSGIGDVYVSVEDDDASDRTSILLTDFELMQCTGLKDKNGKEIYEGDIIEFEDGDIGVNGDADTFFSKGEVTWEDELAMFSVSNRVSTELEDLWTGRIEVIGNIYENKELLNE